LSGEVEVSELLLRALYLVVVASAIVGVGGLWNEVIQSLSWTDPR
jgi:ABC-type proline/glycine betaine transport system permease subunit